MFVGTVRLACVEYAQGRELLRTQAYGESRKGPVQADSSLDALMSPCVFDSHIRACTENAGPYIAEVLGDERGWE